MRYAIFSDIHANLEALEAVLAKIDEIAQKEPIDQIWFLGDLVGYGPNPNECISKLREHTNIIIAGNHDWAAIGKIDLEDFSPAARISAEWTSEQLTEEHRAFLADLPEKLEIEDCTLVHGSPFGPLWEYLTSSALAERSFQYFTTRYCLVGHTHVPVIFQQPDSVAIHTVPQTASPTLPLVDTAEAGTPASRANESEIATNEEEDETLEMVASRTSTPPAVMSVAEHAESAYADPETGQAVDEEKANEISEARLMDVEQPEIDRVSTVDQADIPQVEEEDSSVSDDESLTGGDYKNEAEELEPDEEIKEFIIEASEGRLNSEREIEELLQLLGLSMSKIEVTNEMIKPPEGEWKAPDGYRAIINPGGVGQPRDGDPRAAFMIYDTEHGFEFYRVPYAIKKTQEKILKAGLPYFLAVRLAEGR